MKKGIYLIAVVFILCLGVVACNDEFTESPAVGALNDDALKNETGVNLLLTGAYGVLDGQYNSGYGNYWGRSPDNWTWEVVGPDAHKGSTDDDQPELKEVELMNWGTNNGFFYARWGVIFAGINRANSVIALINSIEEGDFSAQLAEARFLRGHFNFELQRMWGNVPYISEENYANTEFNQPNSGPIWDQIEADFDYGVNNLPNSQDVAGRPTSWTAKSYLGKVHLYQSDWSQAATLLNDVVNNGPYILLDEYVDNFTSSGENAGESIFAIQFAADAGQSYNGNEPGTLNFPNPGPFGSCCGFYQPTQDLANAFQTDGAGLPLLDTYNQTDIANDYGVNSADPFTPHTGPLDPRIDYTVGRRGIDYNGYGVNVGKDWIRAGFGDISGPYLAKKNVYQNGDTDNVGTGGWGQQLSGINYHIIRFADVLLMAAEAAVETGDVPTALANVNRVRQRAKNMTYVQASGGGNAANYDIELYGSFPNPDYARKAVRFERRVELGMEAHRYFDIRRWGVSVQVMNEYFTNEARTIGNFGQKVSPYTATHDLFPIPLGAIDLSGGALSQNPGF